MISLNRAIAAVIVVTLVNGFFSTNMFKKYGDMYNGTITELRISNDKLKQLALGYLKSGYGSYLLSLLED